MARAKPPKPTLTESLDQLATTLGHDAHVESLVTGDRAYRERMGLDLDETLERYWDMHYRPVVVSAVLAVGTADRPAAVDALIERARERYLAAAGDAAGAEAYANGLSKKTRHQLAQRMRQLRFHDGLAPRKIVVLSRAEVQQRLGAEATATTSDEPRAPEIEAAIDEDPYDPIRYGVYADWLQDQGHPRGELIALQLAAERDSAIRPRADAHFERHIDSFLGQLAQYVRGYDHRRRTESLTWRFGFVHGAFVVGSETGFSASTMMRDVFAHPSGRFLAELAVSDTRYDANLQPAIELLVARRPATLRKLTLGGERTDWRRPGAEKGDLSKAWPRLSSLHELALRGQFVLGDIALPQVTRVELRLAAYDGEALRAIERAAWPALETLEIAFDHHHAVHRERLHAWLAALDLPNLVELRFCDSREGDALAGALARAPGRDRLRRLTFARCGLTAEGARTLGAAGLELERLDVRECRVSPEGLEILRRLAKQLEFQPQWQ